MDPKNKKTETLSALAVGPDLYRMIAEDAAANFEKIPDCVRRRLEASFTDSGAVIVKTVAQELRERKEILAVEKMERDAAKDRKEVLTVDEAVAVVEQNYSQIRQSLLSFAASAALDLALPDDQRDRLAAMTQDLMTDLSGEKRETFDDIARQH